MIVLTSEMPPGVAETKLLVDACLAIRHIPVRQGLHFPTIHGRGGNLQEPGRVCERNSSTSVPAVTILRPSGMKFIQLQFQNKFSTIVYFLRAISRRLHHRPGWREWNIST